MKKSTMAVAALLTVLAAPVVSVAFADDASTPAASCKGCSGNTDSQGCAGSADCKGCGGCSGD